MIPDGAPRGLFCAGDVVRQSPADFNVHRGARGLSQEKALVTGLAAAEQAAKDFLGLREVSASVQPLAVDADEEHRRPALYHARDIEEITIETPKSST